MMNLSIAVGMNRSLLLVVCFEVIVYYLTTFQLQLTWEFGTRNENIVM